MRAASLGRTSVSTLGILLLLGCLDGGVAKSAGAAMISGSVISLDSKDWLLATDAKNVGRDQKWFDGPAHGAKAARVPGILQEVFPTYHGVAWYWRDVNVPANPHVGGRYLLRFWNVDYLGNVWINGVHVGEHDGACEPFVLDVTDAVKPAAVNHIAVRVLNVTNEPIDGIALRETAHTAKTGPWVPGRGGNWGGITDSVELIIAPAFRVEDLFVRPDPKTGIVRVQANLRNAGKEPVSGHVLFGVAPAAGGETLHAVQVDRSLPPGDTVVAAELKIQNPRLWQLNDPFLYRVTAIMSGDGSTSFDECATRCGFRDFRLENGYFRLNGKRVFLKSSHTGCDVPVGMTVPLDPDLIRRDLLNCKVMGMNMIRSFTGLVARRQIELCDEIGLMLYQENYAGWFMEESPKMVERMNRATAAMIKRDRNHPCIVMWGLLNENGDGPVFRHALTQLPLVRSLDDTRVVLLNSGRFDNAQNIAGVDAWTPEGRGDPCVNHNGTDRMIEALGIKWTPGRLVLHPGANGEYAVVRWTAPAGGKADLAITFSNASATATTDVHVLHNGHPMFNGFINLNNAGPEAKFHGAIEVQQGDNIDCVVGWGNQSYGADSTGLDCVVAIGGKKYDAAKEFSTQSNPTGPWVFGRLPPGDQPKADAFAKFTGVGVTIGSISNPGTVTWQDILADQHPYQGLPHNASIINILRTINQGDKPYWLSEYGIGSAVDLARLMRHYEQIGQTACEDAMIYRGFLDRFMTDWKRWNMGDTFANPEDYFRQCVAWMAPLRKFGTNAIRANPHVIGHSVTGTQDQGLTGEGLTANVFRELKPGVVDAMFDAFAPLRWCLFVEPMQVYRGRKAKLEAVLANEDVLAPGDYPARLQVVGPRGTNVFDRTIVVKIPDPQGKPEPAFAIPVFAEEAAIDGPSGKYRFLATFEKGAAAAGGELEFYVAGPAEIPNVETEVVVWGDDPDLGKWLGAHGIKTRSFDSAVQTAREVILVGRRAAAGGGDGFAPLARQIARGSHAIFLCPEVFKKGDNPVGWLPLKNKGGFASLPTWVYHKDDWTKNHPIFDGLPAGGIMDHTFYREVISSIGWVGQEVPTEVVAGSINTGCGYDSALLVFVQDLGAGRFTVNTLRIRESLGNDPVAERLLRNMLRYAARDVKKPLADLPDGRHLSSY
jgi:hypothetical protein